MKKTILIICFSFIFISIYSQNLKDTIKLKEVEIKSEHLFFINSKITESEIKNTLIRDVGDYLRTIPNVSGVRKGGSSIDPVVRGFKYSQVDIILDDGIRIEGGCPNRMDPVNSRVEAEEIEKIEVIKGPFVLKYGPAMGSVINLVTTNPKPFDKNEIHVKFFSGFESNWNGYSEQLSLYGGGKKVYYHLTGGLRNYGNYKDGNGNTINSSFSKYNYSAKLGIIPFKNQELLLTYKESHSRDVMYPALPMDEVSDDSRIISVNYNIVKLSDKINYLKFKIYNSDVTHVMDNSERANYNSIVPPYAAIMKMDATVKAMNIGGNASMGFDIGKSNLTLGIDFINTKKDGTRNMRMINDMMDSKTKINLFNNAEINNYGVTSEYKTNFKSYNFIFALRGDYNQANSGDTLKINKENIDYFGNNQSEYFNFSGSFCVNKEINKNLSLGIAIGRGTRSPNMLERYIKLMLIGYDNYDYLGNPQLKPEANNEVDFTIKYKTEKIDSAYFNVFYAYVQNYITGKWLPPLVAKPKTMGAVGVKQFVNIDYVIFKGFEFGYNSPDSKKIGIGIVACRTIASIKNTPKYIIKNNQVTGKTILEKDALPEIPPLEATLTLSYKLLKNKIIPKVSARIIAEQDYISEAYYEMKTPCFVLANLSVSYKINKYFNTSAGVTNIFNKAYYEHLNRRIVGSTNNLYEPGIAFFINFTINI